MAARMRSWAVAGFTLLAVGTARAGDAAPLAAATNLDFEAAAAPSGAPAGWNFKGEKFVAALESEGVHGGKACARVATPSGATGWGSGWFTQTIAAAPLRGKRVRVTSFLRLKDLNGYAGMTIEVKSADKEMLAIDRRQDHARDGTSDWAMDTVVVDVAAAAETIEYGMVVSGSGTAWVDDVVVETVGPDVPSTDLKSCVRAPANLDFEGEVHPRGMPLNWRGGMTGYDFTYDTDAPHGGKKSGKLAWASASEPPDTAWTPCGQTIPAASWRGKRVRLAGWLRTKDATRGGASLWLRVDGTTDTPIAYEDTSAILVTGTSGWTHIDIVMDIPQAAEQLVYGVMLHGGGAAWCDDLEFAAVGPEVPLSIDPLMADPPLAESAEKANLDFEAGADAEGRPAGWRGPGRAFTASVDTKVFHGGKASGCVAAGDLVAAHPDLPGALVRQLPADPYRGKRVRLTGWMRTEKASENPNSGAGIFLLVSGADPGAPLAMADTSDHALHGDTDWTLGTIVLDVPDGAKSLTVYAGLGGPGKAWADDFKIEVVGADVPLTEKK